MSLAAIGKLIFGFIEPLIKPLMLWLKGYSDGKRKAKIDSLEHFNKVTNDGNKSIADARVDGLRNPNSDENAHFRD